ncbi:ABC transporter substrate-binding protein [Paenibacillus sp. NPDC056579]|uniref:ABC transporter substrate-binding protein n=1 Tax=Paenibacillus sp. NPDC056579 TaxID=3345871 RepID=UPI003685CC31
MVFHVSRAPFDDRNVRLAASYAIDKDGIVGSLLSGIESRADSLLDPAMPYSNVNLTPYPYDKQKAIDILEQAGWVDLDGDGLREKNGVKRPYSLLYRTSNG